MEHTEQGSASDQHDINNDQDNSINFSYENVDNEMGVGVELEDNDSTHPTHNISLSRLIFILNESISLDNAKKEVEAEDIEEFQDLVEEASHILSLDENDEVAYENQDEEAQQYQMIDPYMAAKAL